MATINEKYLLEVRIPDEFFVREDAKEYVAHRLEHLKREGAFRVFDEIYKANHPTVVETHIEEFRDPSCHYTVYRLHYRLTAVRIRDVTWIEPPVFTFTNYQGKIEWKCPACSIINSIEATYCGEKHERAVGCGRPREKVRQEM